MGITGPAPFGFERLWLSRSIKSIPDHPELFKSNSIEEAQHLLGLGNRQVLAVEYWLKSMRLVEKINGKTTLSKFGAIVKEFDPQFEEKETWVFLHHNLTFKPDGATTYWFAFRKLPYSFNKSTLMEGLRVEFPGKSQQTYKDAVKVFYSIINRTEINTLCGFVQIQENTVLKIQDPPSLGYGPFAYALLDWAKQNSIRTAHFSQLLSVDGPAKPFSLTNMVLNDYLDQIQEHYAKKVLWVSRTGGLNSVAFEPNIPPLAILRAYYLEHLEGLEPLKALEKGIKEELKTSNS